MVISLDGLGHTKATVLSRGREKVSLQKSTSDVKRELKVSIPGVQGGKPGRVWQAGGSPILTGVSLREALENLRNQAEEEIFIQFKSLSGRIFTGFKRDDASEKSSKLIPFFAGVAPHGSQIEVIITDLAGSEIGRSNAFADAAGNWSLLLPGVLLNVQPYRVEIALSLSAWEDSPPKFYRANLSPELLEKILQHESIAEEIFGALIPVVSSETGFGDLSN